MTKNKTPFKVGETYKTQSGKNARVLHIMTEVREFPILCLHEESDSVISHTVNGWEYCRGGSPNDLISPMKRVPLGPEDVPPGSVVTANQGIGWCMVNSASINGISTKSSDWTWEQCRQHFEIKRPTDADWQPMWK